jgi:hypothetical protein
MLPFPGLAARGEWPHLSCDDGIGVGLGEAAPDHPAPAVAIADNPGNLRVVLNAIRLPCLRVAVHLLIERGENRGSVHDGIPAARLDDGQSQFRPARPVTGRRTAA